MPYKNKEDRNAQTRRWRAENPEESRKQQAKWREKNRNRLNAAVAAWALLNKDRIRENNAARYQRDKERICARNEAYRRANPEASRARVHKRRTLKTKAGGAYTAAEWFTLCFAVGFKCLCCGETKILEPDHVVPVSRGGSSWLHNIQPLCESCNTKKNNKIIDFRIKYDLKPI